MFKIDGFIMSPYGEEVFAILDWYGNFNTSVIYDYSGTKRLKELQSKGLKDANGFTGKYYKAGHVILTLFRKQYWLTWEWGHGNMDPKEAKLLYTARKIK